MRHAPHSGVPTELARHRPHTRSVLWTVYTVWCSSLSPRCACCLCQRPADKYTPGPPDAIDFCEAWHSAIGESVKRRMAVDFTVLLWRKDDARQDPRDSGDVCNCGTSLHEGFTFDASHRSSNRREVARLFLDLPVFFAVRHLCSGLPAPELERKYVNY